MDQKGLLPIGHKEGLKRAQIEGSNENVKFDKRARMFDNIIKSVSESQTEIMTSIIWLYCKKGIEIDLTYGKGGIWRGVESAPERRFDLNPSGPEVEKADVRELPFKSGSVYSVLFDPPFIAGGGLANSTMGRRYGYFDSPAALSKFYEQSLTEIYRVLKLNGWLIFKC